MAGETSFLSSFSYPPYLSQIVKVILPPDPFVVGFSAVGFSGDVSDISSLTVVELALKELGENRIKSAGEVEDLVFSFDLEGNLDFDETLRSGLTTGEIWVSLC